MTNPNQQPENPQKHKSESSTTPSLQWTNLQLLSNYLLRNWHPGWILLLITMLTTFTMTAYKIGLLDGFLQPSTNIKPTLCDSIEFEMLEEGMSIAEVRALMENKGTQISNNGNSSTHVWKKNGVKITVQFQKAELVSHDRDWNCD